MSRVALMRPESALAEDWPRDHEAIRCYVEAFARDGSRTYIANLRTSVRALRIDDAVLPVTVNEAEYGDAFVCLPHSAYALYSKAELDLVQTGAMRPLLSAAADVAGAVLRAAKVNRVVHVNNWMSSTNLHQAWPMGTVGEVRSHLLDIFPGHLIAVRSLSDWANADLIAELRSDGWRLVPSRQIFVMDDLDTQWRSRRNILEDVKLLRSRPDAAVDLDRLAPGDAERIAELYQDLYLQKYTILNPAFTAAFIRLTHESGVWRYRGVREGGGRLCAVAATMSDGKACAPQIVAYDRTRPQPDGLYRIAMTLGLMMAREEGLKLNWSAGAGRFKASRGARPALEYTAFYDAHLSRSKRMVMSALEQALRSFVVPFVQAKGF